MNLYAKILIGVNEGQTLYVSKYNPKNETILVNVRGNNFAYAKSEYQKIDMYKNAWSKEMNN